jgi:hypothetical protein
MMAAPEARSSGAEVAPLHWNAGCVVLQLDRVHAVDIPHGPAVGVEEAAFLASHRMIAANG